MRLLNARIPAAVDAVGSRDATNVDILIEGPRIAGVSSPGRDAPPRTPEGPDDLDCAGGMVLPAFVDMHTHLDKGHVWPRTPNPDGTFDAALAATARDRTAHWTAHDVRRRMDFALRCAEAHGTAAIRTHIDSMPPQDRISWPVFAEMRERWADRIALQGVSLAGIDDVPDDPAPVFDFVTEHGGIVGAVLYPTGDMPRKLRAILAEAGRRGLDVDFHVDETLDPSVDCLAEVAAAALELGFDGRIVCGHCCSLMTMPASQANRTLDAVARAGIAIVSLPLCNLYLQDRAHRGTPRVRGGTLVHEMAERGIPVAIASDNVRDPFYAYGDLDMAEVYREATRILHLDHPVGDWPRAVTATPAALMRLPDRDRIERGMIADLVVFRARDWSEFLSRPQVDRTVIRAGRVADAPLPDYRELDDLFA